MATTSAHQKRKVSVFTKEEAKRQNAGLKVKPDAPAVRKRKHSPSPHSDRGERPRTSGMGKLVQAHKKKRKKALARKKKFAKQLRGEKTLLEYASIKEPARKDYCRKLEGFYAFVVKYEMDIRNENLLDAALCEYAEHLYLDGEDSHYGQKLRAALEFDRPEFSREGGLALPRFKRALKGWRRLAPTQTRLPTPEMLKACVSGIFLHKGWKEEALFNEVTFSTYARPGETLRVMAEDVVPPGKERRVVQGGDLRRGAAVGRQESTLAAKVDDRPGCRLKPVSPYQNRHGGASRDHLKKLRSIPEIQRRGRWSSDMSARIYDKPGRLQQTLNVFGEKYAALGEALQCNFGIYYQSGCQALPKHLRLQLSHLCSKKCF